MCLLASPGNHSNKRKEFPTLLLSRDINFPLQSENFSIFMAKIDTFPFHIFELKSPRFEAMVRVYKIQRNLKPFTNRFLNLHTRFLPM